MRRPPRNDLLLAAGLLVAMGVEQATGSLGLSWADLVYVPACIALAWRRHAPVASLIALTLLGSSEVLEPRNTNGLTVFGGIVLSLVSITLYAPRRRVVPGAATATALVVAIIVLVSFNDQQNDTLAEAIANGMFFGLIVLCVPPLVLGHGIRRQGELRRQLEERARELEVEREHHGAAAAAQERERMAGDLHTVVADGVRSMLVELAGARGLVLEDPERASDAILAVEERGRDALTELRELLGVLRRGDEDLALAPQPSLARLDALARRLGEAGIEVVVRTEGAPVTLTPGLDVAAFRVVEDALAHAPNRAEVLVRWADRELELDVAVPGPELGDASRLASARERVALFGGRLDAGRRSPGGTAMSARLPLERLHTPAEAR